MSFGRMKLPGNKKNMRLSSGDYNNNGRSNNGSNWSLNNKLSETLVLGTGLLDGDVCVLLFLIWLGEKSFFPSLSSPNPFG
jgi:hypothetical protein